MFLRVTHHILSASQRLKISTQNSNTHKCLPVIDMVDKVIHGHGPNKAL